MQRLILVPTAVLVLTQTMFGAERATTAPQAEAPGAVTEVRAESLRKNLDPDGRPLPLAAHWHSRFAPLDMQIRLIEQGHHLLPWGYVPQPALTNAADDKQFVKLGPSFDKLAALKLPFALISGQWEADLYDHQKSDVRPRQWRVLPPEQSPLVVPVTPQFRTDGTPKPPTAKMLSPFGAVEPWREVGKVWMGSPGMRKLQDIYPTPPLVVIISNNESTRLKKAEEDKRYLDKYGPGRDAAFQNKAMADGWIERYGAMLKSMRESLTQDAWRKNSRFVAYNAFGPAIFGKTSCDPDRIAWDWYAWDGGIPEYYDNNWQMPKKAICNVWSCQTESMNWVFMKAAALKVNPDYWFEFICWDGDSTTYSVDGTVIKYSMRGRMYNDMGFPPTPERYRGWIQYGMWLTLPRVVRQWNGFSDPSSQWWPKFAEIIRAVDLVYADPVLTRFWRKGELVANPEGGHPWIEAVPARFKDVPRWFHLSTDLDPARPWNDDTRMPVFTLARVIGQARAREWLVYAEATLENQRQVRIRIPGYRQITVPVSTGGSFYHVKEADGSVTPVGNAAQIKLAALDADMAAMPAPVKKATPNQEK